jgi:nucleoid-associated protein YgaU
MQTRVYKTKRGAEYTLTQTKPPAEKPPRKKAAAKKATAKKATAKKAAAKKPEAKKAAAKKAPAKKLGKMVKMLGYEVREGTQKHKQLLQQREHAEDLRRSETAMDGRTKQHRDGQLKLWG